MQEHNGASAFGHVFWYRASCLCLPTSYSWLESQDLDVGLAPNSVFLPPESLNERGETFVDEGLINKTKFKQRQQEESINL